MKGLSGIWGNLYVPFLGGWAGAISPGYPVSGGNVASLPECAEHVQQFGGASPLPNLMEVKG